MPSGSGTAPARVTSAGSGQPTAPQAPNAHVTAPRGFRDDASDVHTIFVRNKHAKAGATVCYSIGTVDVDCRKSQSVELSVSRSGSLLVVLIQFHCHYALQTFVSRDP